MESYTYDYRGLVLSETNKNQDTRYYTYDALGRLTQKTDRNERVTTYNYDAMGRLTSEKWLGESDAVLKTFAYTYDAVGNLLTVSDGEHSYSYTYNNLNQNVTTTFNFDEQTAVFNYVYDAVGRQTESSLTLNSTQTRVNQVTYDFLGNATKINQTGSAIDEIFAEFDYNANGLLTSVRRYEVDADDVATSIANSIYEYNANNAVTSITHNNSSGTQIVKHSYTYDSTNNIVEYLNSLDGNTTYNYDFLGQLISADYSNAEITDESYTYDSNGNRLTANGDEYTTSTNNELTSDGNYTYTYDEGNRISKTNSTERELYEWDYRNRLTSVTQQEWDSTTETWTTTQTIEYTYDYNNVWIRKVIGNDKTIFIPENYQTVTQIDNGTVTHHYLWTPNTQDKLLADVTADNVLWTLTDHLGSIRDVVGNSTTHLIYDAFGNLISGTNPILFGYTGKPFDIDTQLQNNINRWYDASIGRWLSQDPIGFNGNDTNLYRYCSNNSQLFTDPNGFGKSKIVGWGLKRLRNGRYIRISLLHTEEQAAKFFKKGSSVLIREGRSVAKSIAERAISLENILHHNGHKLKNGKTGLSHFQDNKDKIKRHIFYSAIAGLLMNYLTKDESVCEAAVDISAVYTDEYPGRSIFAAGTFSYWFGEDSYIAAVDWINPLDIFALADVGRDIDREASKQLIGIIVTLKDGSSPSISYALDKDGQLVSVTHWIDGVAGVPTSSEDFFQNLGTSPEQNKDIEFVKKISSQLLLQ